MQWKDHLLCFATVFIICSISTVFSIVMNLAGINRETLLIIFLVGVLLSTVATKGYIYGFLASIFNVFLFNYFFTEPLHTFAISSGQDVILIAFFLLASLICGTISAKFRRQTEIATQNEKMARLMYDITESFLNLTGTEGIVNHGIHYIYEHTQFPCKVTLDHTKFDVPKTVFYTENFPEKKLESEEYYTLPIKGLSAQIGIITFFYGSKAIHNEELMLIKTAVYQMALVLDREFIYSEREKIKLAMEGEHLKSTLLRSISHDIRTPLTGILGASSLLLEQYDTLDDASIKKLISDMNEQSSWLVMTVQNILDMTRISDGKLVVKKTCEAVDDLINQVISHVPLLVSANRLKITMPDEIILVEADGKLFVQVLLNLLDNAYKHSGKDTIIELNTYRKQNHIVFEVSDNGCGIHESIIHTVFDGFVTLPGNESDRGRGVGLGLSICKTIVEAHGGTITASNKPEGGAKFCIELPCEEAAL